MNYQELLNKLRSEGNEKKFTSHGYECRIMRVSFMPKRPELGHLCGYVGIPKTHPYASHTGNRLKVHGGITFGGAKGFPREKRDDIVVFGFDCAHSGDLNVSSIEMLADVYGGVNGYLKKHEYDVYRDMEYVTAECEKLAKQLKDLE